MVIVGQIGGAVLDADVVGHNAYVGVGPRLRIVDVLDPTHPATVGETSVLAASVEAVDVVDGHACVAAGASGLRVIDVTDPVAPRLVAGLDTSGSAEGVFVRGNDAYVADGAGGLRVMDVTSPADPREVGAVDMPDQAWGVYVAGARGGLRVVDVTNPDDPREVGSAGTPGEAHDVYVSADRAYPLTTGTATAMVRPQCAPGDVDTVPDEGIARRGDDEVWRLAQMSERFLITQDLDFYDIRRYRRGTHHDVLLVRLRNPSANALRSRMDAAVASSPPRRRSTGHPPPRLDSASPFRGKPARGSCRRPCSTAGSRRTGPGTRRGRSSRRRTGSGRSSWPSEITLMRVTGATAPVTLTMSSWWDIEAGYDYGYVEARADAGAPWVSLPDLTGKLTDANADGVNLGWGLTGPGEGHVAAPLAAMTTTHVAQSVVAPAGLCACPPAPPALGTPPPAIPTAARSGTWTCPRLPAAR